MQIPVSFPSCLLACLILFVKVGSGSAIPNGDGCVNPTSMKSCLSARTDAYSACNSQCKSASQSAAVCYAACELVYEASQVACYAENCWNLRYGCEYQMLVAQYLLSAVYVNNLPQPDLPFYPAPSGAPSSGACACNIGLLLHITFGNHGRFSCSPSVPDDYFRCLCCYDSQEVTGLYDLCPHNNITFVQAAAAIANDVAYVKSRPDGCAFLGSSNAASTCAKYSAVLPTLGGSISSYVNPTALPSGFPGTLPLTDISGSAPSPSDLPTTSVLSLVPAYTTTITFAAAKGGSNNQAGSTTPATTTISRSGAARTAYAKFCAHGFVLLAVFTNMS